MKYNYNNSGTCSRSVSFDITDGIITDVRFEGGCNGNLKAISRLVEGKDAKEIANILKGNTCGPRPTSCADQLARAIEKALTDNQ